MTRGGAQLPAIALWLAIGAACGEGPSASSPDESEHGHAESDSDHDHDSDHDALAGAHDHAAASMIDAGAAPPDGSIEGDFVWDLPSDFPRPIVPADNPMSTAKVELGRYLFYDQRLSDNETFSCASCHKQALAFADERATGLGSTGEHHSRGAMSLANVAYSPTLTWANPLLTTLERQAAIPIFGDSPIELGIRSVDEVEERLRPIPRYRELFGRAFPAEAEPITMLNVERALASFQRTLISGNSAYDRYVNAGEESALSESAKRGMLLVTSNEVDEQGLHLECNHCHGGFNFSDHVVWEGLDERGMQPPYHQTGLYDVDGKGSYPEPNTGVYDTSLRRQDMGKFKAPTLRNIALTAPYMHDGSIKTLSEVLDHYARGGRARREGVTDPLLQPFELTEQQKADIIAFLESLTDESFIEDPRFSDPWADD